MRTFVLAITLLVGLQTTDALGQDVPTPEEAAKQAVGAEANQADTQQSVRLTGPRTGVAVSSIVFAGGAGTLVFGGILHTADLGDGVVLATGAALAGAGLIGIIVSTVKLRQAKQKLKQREKREGVVTLAPPPQRPAMLRF